MELLASDPPIDLYDPTWPILTHAEPLPPARVLCDGRRGEVTNSMLANGTVVGAAQVSSSVLASNVHVGDDCFIEEAVILPGARIGPAASCGASSWTAGPSCRRVRWPVPARRMRAQARPASRS